MMEKGKMTYQRFSYGEGYLTSWNAIEMKKKGNMIPQ